CKRWKPLSIPTLVLDKNSHICLMLSLVMLRSSNLEVIDHKFLISGHTHMECDSDDSIIEKKKKQHQTPIGHPRNWIIMETKAGF
ncbi:hypothetical protein ILUMI_17329, partial [Ignelater luminosus]